MWLNKNVSFEMTTSRHKRSNERDEAKAIEFAESVWEKFKHTFPNAKKWVIFSSVAAQHEAGIGEASERLSKLEFALDEFLVNTDYFPEPSEDILVIFSASCFVTSLADFATRQRMVYGPLNYGISGDDPLPDAVIAYDAYWTE